ncbi:TonB family protein [Pacificispira sp.]|uniref:energy transducer TonB n=1 Tax=Pacificispira sp. TaxID=2888761 RepID=UPI003BA8DA1F
MSEAVQWPEELGRAARPALTLVSRNGMRAAFDAGARDTDAQVPEPPRMARFVTAALLMHVGLAAALTVLRVDPLPPEPPEIGFEVAFEGGGAGSGSMDGIENPESTAAQEPSGPAHSVVPDPDPVQAPTEPVPAQPTATPHPVEPDAPSATDAAPDMPLADTAPAPRPVFRPAAKPPMPARPLDADAVRAGHGLSPEKPAVPAPSPHLEPTPEPNMTAQPLSNAMSASSDEPGAGLERRIDGPANSGGSTGEAAGAGESAEPGWMLGSANNPPPRYPYSARIKGWEGRVVLLVLVDATGRVVSVEIAESAGRRTLDNAARDAVLGWIFEPGRKAGFPVKTTVRVPIRFQLSPAS